MGWTIRFRTTAFLSKARKRWGKEVFLSLFSRVVLQCVEAGLVEGPEIHIDASLVAADASLKSVKPLKPEVIKAIEQTVQEQLQKLDELRRGARSTATRRRWQQLRHRAIFQHESSISQSGLIQRCQFVHGAFAKTSRVCQ